MYLIMLLWSNSNLFNHQIFRFCSILSKREISNIGYIQGDVSLIYGTETHTSWIIAFAIPGLGIIGILIPFSLFFLMYINREQLD